VFLSFQVDLVVKEGLEIVGTLGFVVYLHIVSSFSFGPKYDAFMSLQACIILAWTLWLSLVLHYATWLSPFSPFPWTFCIFLCPRPNGSVSSCYYLSRTLDLFCGPSEV
jgi:hypothetical protein